MWGSYTHAHIHTCTHVHTHTYTHIHTHRHTHTHTHTRTMVWQLTIHLQVARLLPPQSLPPTSPPPHSLPPSLTTQIYTHAHTGTCTHTHTRTHTHQQILDWGMPWWGWNFSYENLGAGHATVSLVRLYSTNRGKLVTELSWRRVRPTHLDLLGAHEILDPKRKGEAHTRSKNKCWVRPQPTGGGGRVPFGYIFAPPLILHYFFCVLLMKKDSQLTGSCSGERFQKKQAICHVSGQSGKYRRVLRVCVCVCVCVSVCLSVCLSAGSVCVCVP